MIIITLLGLILFAILLGVSVEKRMSHIDTGRYPPPGRLVDIGGYRLHIHCMGNGGPLVVLDSGLGDSSQVWALIQQKVSQRVRVCSYDRAGLGWSDPGPLPRTYQQAARELHQLLKVAGEAPPYIMVGHSAGVNTIRLYIDIYPEEVAGLVLIEPPILTNGVPPTLVTILRAGRIGINSLARVGLIRMMGKYSLLGILFGGANPPKELSDRAGFLYRPQSVKTTMDEIDAIQESISLVNASVHPSAWGDRPVIVIAAYKGTALPENLAQSLHSLARLSTRGQVVSVKGSHFIHFEQPDLVSQSILEIVESVKY